jgi:hypothetical protein
LALNAAFTDRKMNARIADLGGTVQWTAGAVMARLLNEILLRSCTAAFAIGVVVAAASLLG